MAEAGGTTLKIPLVHDPPPKLGSQQMTERPKKLVIKVDTGETVIVAVLGLRPRKLERVRGLEPPEVNYFKANHPIEMLKIASIVKGEPGEA